MSSRMIKVGDKSFNIVRDYLTSDELDGIIKAVASHRGYMDRINTYDAIITGLVTDLEDFKGDSVDVSVLDEYRHIGAFKAIEEHIKSRDIVERGVKYEDSINTQLKDFIQYAQVQIDKLPKATKNVSTNKLIKAITDVADKMTDVVSAKEHLNDNMQN